MDSETCNNWMTDWLKTQSDFHTPSDLKSFDGNLLTMYFFNIHDKYTAKQANVMGNFPEVLAENQSKNVNIISI